MTLQSQPNGNPPNGPIFVKAVPLGSADSDGYQLVLAADGSTLVATSYSPLADACRALRAAGEANMATCVIMRQVQPTAANIFVPADTGLVGSYGYAGTSGA